jgi:hypothetical protein
LHIASAAARDAARLELLLPSFLLLLLLHTLFLFSTCHKTKT